MQKNSVHRAESGLFSDFSNELVYNQSTFSSLITTPFSISAFASQIAKKAATYPEATRSILVDTLKRHYQQLPADVKVLENIEKLASPDTYTITTGHQLNIFTGPVYFIYKILHVINLCETLAKEYPEQQFVPVYWMASEDHDFEEINHTRLFGKRIEWDAFQGGPVGMYDLKEWEQLQAAVREFFSNHPETEIFSLLDNYRGTNLAEATRSFVNALFGKYGLLIIEPNDRSYKELFKPLMQKEAGEPFVKKAIDQADAILQEKGFKPPVFAREINLFYIEKGIRERLVPENGQITIEGKGSFSTEEILLQIANHPENFSPNVAMRPLYQECILPNLAYIGGGGEIAYWTQFKGIFDACEIPYPLIQVRNSLQLIDANTQKKIQKAALSLSDLFKDINELKKQYVLDHSGEELDFTAMDQQAEQLKQLIEQQILEVDPGFGSFAGAEITKLGKQLEGIKAKLVKQQKSKFDGALKQIEDIKEKLFPGGTPQERKDNFLTFCPDGNVSSFIDLLKEAMNPLEKDLIILNLD